MRGFYGIQPRTRNALKRNRGTNANPTKPDNRLFETDMGGGFTRVDAGAPPVRLPSETQPVPKAKIDGHEVAPVETAPPIVDEPTPRGPVPRKVQPTNWQREFGLGK